MTVRQLQRLSAGLLDAIEQYCQAEAAAPGNYLWKRAAAAATADAYCLREGTMSYVIHATYRGGRQPFDTTAACRQKHLGASLVAPQYAAGAGPGPVSQ